LNNVLFIRKEKKKMLLLFLTAILAFIKEVELSKTFSNKDEDSKVIKKIVTGFNLWILKIYNSI